MVSQHLFVTISDPPKQFAPMKFLGPTVADLFEKAVYHFERIFF